MKKPFIAKVADSGWGCLACASCTLCAFTALAFNHVAAVDVFG